ncbi:(2Fe-2S)-binding protein [Nocardioides sp.]|uniref:(2Fe-2S)-binding protein n=1 Tax=Nocardioides sp. TaxID=35761 RepID=UPI0031FEFED6|nr:(2Fe-2S)-binding protein [Nocardioides sp.]
MTPETSEQQLDVTVTVNGRQRSARVPSRMLLSDFLRHELGLYGTRVGCEHGVCGACTVLMDGAPARACLVFAAQADNAEIRTVEGLANGADGLTPLQAAFQEEHALQCGFCTPGMLMTLTEFLEDNPGPVTDQEVREAIAGNLCRCTGYQNIVRAVVRVAGGRDEDGAAR